MSNHSSWKSHLEYGICYYLAITANSRATSKSEKLRDTARHLGRDAEGQNFGGKVSFQCLRHSSIAPGEDGSSQIE